MKLKNYKNVTWLFIRKRETTKKPKKKKSHIEYFVTMCNTLYVCIYLLVISRFLFSISFLFFFLFVRSTFLNSYRSMIHANILLLFKKLLLLSQSDTKMGWKHLVNVKKGIVFFLLRLLSYFVHQGKTNFWFLFIPRDISMMISVKDIHQNWSKEIFSLKMLHRSVYSDK